MINNVIQAISNKLAELYPTNKIYANDIPQDLQKPSFIINLINHEYVKRLNAKYMSVLSFDVAYYSNSDITRIKEDCYEVQLNLFREFELLDSYRVLNKQAKITDNVLHFTFKIKYSEMKVEIIVPMQQHETTTNI